MATIRIEQRGEDSYRVEVSEGSSRTTHDVQVTPDDLRRYGGDAGAENLLRASFEFLLEREPKEAILDRFDLPVIERYFPDYPRTIGERLGEAGESGAGS
jgi:hypothetical protein